MHRDLKLANIPEDIRESIKLWDFSLSGRFAAGQNMDVVCGTLLYCVCKIFLQEEYDFPAVEIYSLGVILYLIVPGCHLFKGTASLQLKEQVLHGRYNTPFHSSMEV